eukprot:7113069-Heterocapsa_arctica.AAC.1
MEALRLPPPRGRMRRCKAQRRHHQRPGRGRMAETTAHNKKARIEPASSSTRPREGDNLDEQSKKARLQRLEEDVGWRCNSSGR